MIDCEKSIFFCWTMQGAFNNPAPFLGKQYCFGWIAVLLSGQSGTALIRWFLFLLSCCWGISRMWGCSTVRARLCPGGSGFSASWSFRHGISFPSLPLRCPKLLGTNRNRQSGRFCLQKVLQPKKRRKFLCETRWKDAWRVLTCSVFAGDGK